MVKSWYRLRDTAAACEYVKRYVPSKDQAHIRKGARHIKAAGENMIKTVWAMYFSGTGTTETMTTHIAKDLVEKTGAEMKSFDFTKKGNSINVYWRDATREVCKKAHKNGMAVLAWFDIVEQGNEKEFISLIENGVDIICCNDPLLAKKSVKYYNYKKYKKRNHWLDLFNRYLN